MRGPAISIDPAVRMRWAALGPEVRAHVSGYLGNLTASEVQVSAADPELPPMFAHDLAAGGGRFRAAFPDLLRRVMAIDGMSVRVACDGVQCGTFFGLVLPSDRRARFTEVHELAFADGRLVADRVAIDVRAVVRQLVGATSCAPAAARAS